MKRPLVRIGLAVWFVLIGMIPLFGAAAQTATPQPTQTGNLSLLEAVPLVREVYGEVLVFEVELDNWQTAAGGVLCWEFITDAGQFCVSTADGSILTGGDRFNDDAPPPVSTETVAPPVTTEAVPPPLTTEDFDDDRSDDDDNTAVTLTQLEAAVAAAMVIYPNGSIREADARFNDRDGIVIIKVEFADDREVDVNAATGEVLGFGISRDDDDSDDDRDDDDDNDDSSGRGSDDDSDDDHDDDNSDDSDDDRDDDNSSDDSDDDHGDDNGSDDDDD